MSKKKQADARYVERKVQHMQRMGISASVWRGAATPDWRKEQIQEEEKRREC